MSEDYIDKLLNDIQDYLREEDKKKQGKRWVLLAARAGALRGKPIAKPIFTALLTLLSACAVGSLTVAILLLGFLGTTAGESVNAVWLLAAGACGLFFCAMLLSAWKRLLLLSRIEENTRLILASKLETNALLDQFMENIS